MNKADRQKIFDKYGGKCAYCGCELQKGWHVDHCSPVHRKTKSIGGNFVTKDTGLEPTGDDFENGNFKQLPRKTVADGMHKPENDTLENMMPSCSSCNLYKHGADLETFRMILTKLTIGLERDEVRYRFAKRYGLIAETNIEVKFYFELMNTPNSSQEQG